MRKRTAIITTLLIGLALAACSNNTIQGRAGNAVITAGVALPICAAVPIAGPAGCALAAFAVGEGVNVVADSGL